MKKFDTPIDLCELKFSKKDKGQFEGYASVFNGVDTYGDTIAPGAFAITLKDHRTPKMFINHDQWGVPVGDWIRLEEDSNGLFVVGSIDFNHKDGKTVYSALERKAMDGISIGYRIPPGGATDNNDGTTTLNTITLREISLVNFPADDSARIAAVKKEIDEIQTLKECEIFLRESGFSRNMAVSIVSRIKGFHQSESVEVYKNQIMVLEKKLQSENVTNSLVNIINKL